MSRRVLVVDDDASIRTFIVEVLEGAGYTVDAAAGGAEALEKVSRAVPDAIILDMWMPSMDGFDVLQPLRASAATRTTPVIAISAAYPPRAAQDLGVHEFLSKPFGVTELLAAVERALAEP